jgi:hypothetical protein
MTSGRRTSRRNRGKAFMRRTLGSPRAVVKYVGTFRVRKRVRKIDAELPVDASGGSVYA